MVGTILSYVAQGVFLLISLILYVLLISCVLPRLLLTVTVDPADVRDRGIKKYLFKNGRAIVYEPAIEARRYIQQYILSDHNGERFLKCKLDSRVRALKYRVVAFSADDSMLTVVDVEEPVYDAGISKAVPLPINTAYVSICVHEVNGVQVENRPIVRRSLIKTGAFVLSTVLLTVIEALMVKKTAVFVLNMILNCYGKSMNTVMNSFLHYTENITFSNSYAVFTAILIGLCYSVIVLLSHYSRHTKYVK